MDYHSQQSRYQPKAVIWPIISGRRSRKIPLVVICVLVVFALYHHSHSISISHSQLQKTPGWKTNLFSLHDDSAEPHERRESDELTPDISEMLLDVDGDGVSAEASVLEDDAVGITAADALADMTADTAADPAADMALDDAGLSDKKEQAAQLEGLDEEVPKRHKSKDKNKSKDDDEDSSRKDKKQTKEKGQKAMEYQQDMVKGPVSVKPDLDQHHEKESLISAPDSPAKEKVIESESAEHLTLEETADSLPDLIHIPFENTVKDMKLQGWEDEWISHGKFDAAHYQLEEPKIDFVYLWVNGSEEAFQETKRPYEENSVLNDPEGKWISSHGVNRYRDWDELKYSIRSVEKYASSFRNKIQILVNHVDGTEAGKQVPSWLKNDALTSKTIQVLSQEEMFDKDKHVCLPTFNSLTIENQLFNTPSDTEYIYALSDDMLLGKPHQASDIHSPLFGPVMGFKTNSYNTVNPPTDADARRFGEKPFLIYTSWLLNRRFGNRKRKGQGHFGHALSRAVMKEAIGSFPGPELQSACKRFRGEPGFQLYSWYITFHYLIERHREAMIWSYIMHRADKNGDGFLDWEERSAIIKDLEKGMLNEGKISYRKRNFFHTVQLTENAGLKGPVVNTEVLWTSLDGPATIMGLECAEYDVNECLAPGFSISSESLGATKNNPMFSTAVIFDRVSRQKPDCGDCMLKLLLNQVRTGLSPVLPDPTTQAEQRSIVVKALMRYRYQIVSPDALFVMVTDAEQVDASLTRKYVRGGKQLAGQLCLNDDVATTDDQELADVKLAMSELYQGLFPDKSPFEI